MNYLQLYVRTRIPVNLSSRVPAVILVCACLLIRAAVAVAGDTPSGAARDAGPVPDAAYHTPLAGMEQDITFLGRSIHIPPRNRDNTRAITLGGIFFHPRLGGEDAMPFAALYWRHRWERSRARAVVSLFVNECDIARSFGRVELLGHLENDTVPFSQEEIVDGKEVTESSLVRGTASAWLGAGLRWPVAPFQEDNDLRLQLFYHAGYLYSHPVAETGSTVRLPPDTFVHGMRFRARYDGVRRNLMELPHTGWAGGVDVELTRRNDWTDANYGGSLFKGDNTRDYVKFSGYLLGAAGIPWLSERNRLLVSAYGGFAPGHNLDRFSAFRIGGGPFPNETDDLWRINYPGAMFNQFPVSDYVVGTVEYRRELLFFLYLHLRETFTWANRDILTQRNLKFSEDRGQTFSVGITSGFPWHSQLYLEYAHDTGILRNGPDGESLLALWSKSF
ncbi:MAG TPA: hypothetical protein VI298_13085 [Geobacteraceae bacterium]